MFLDFLFGRKISGKTISVETRNNIDRDWKNIQVLLSSKGPSQLRQALITADKCLDNALRDIVAGETMGERLKNAETRFDRDLYNKIWEAHKVRNNLVHESGYEPPYFVVTQSVDSLKIGLQTLGINI
ncbi:hypothetical protein K0B04_01650 [Patescibacteria group bacterium]|nr:hypothetical protein [Patescibacteria group bacterium]